MAFNGAGTFTRLYSWISDAAAGIFVDATRADTDSNDIASGLSNCICKDGQTTITANIPFASKKITLLGDGTSYTDGANVANANSQICEFRLTLTTGVPVTTADVTAAGTVYVSPYKGFHIALYDGSAWHMRTSAQMSIAVPATTSTMYDLFCYDNATVPTLEALAWTNDTTRATALALQDGVLSKSGALTRRYLGSFRTTTVAGQTEDSLAKRYVWNYYNRVQRPMRVVEATASWNYTTATVRQANGAAANQLDFIMGYGEDAVRSEVAVSASNNAGGSDIAVGIGLDSTTVINTGGIFPQTRITSGTGAGQPTVGAGASLRVYPGVGRHTLAWLEYSTAVGVTTWYSAWNGVLAQSGIQGEVLG